MHHLFSKVEKLLRRKHWTLQIYTRGETVVVDILEMYAEDELVDSFSAPNLIVAFTTLANLKETP